MFIQDSPEHTPEDFAFVAYFVAIKKSKKGLLAAQHCIDSQKQNLDAFHKKHPKSQLLETFIETNEHKRHHLTYQELQAAVKYCIEHRAHLVIGEVKHLLCDEQFVTQLQPLIQRHQAHVAEFKPAIYCLDQPIISISNVEAFSSHAIAQKKVHGELIKAGLSRSSAKSGNPHAADIINKVNRPKIENAIIFALLLQPVIEKYLAQGDSQRKIVATLNEQGFCAPEGGKWVLSQFQKVLERIRYCEAAIKHENRFKQYQEQALSNEEIVEHLNKMDIPSLKGQHWTVQQVEKVQDKIKELENLFILNELAVAISPILERYHFDELTEDVFLSELEKAGISVPDALRSKAA